MPKRKSSEVNDKFDIIEEELVDAKKQRVSVISQTIKIVKKLSVVSNGCKKSTGSIKVLLVLM